MMSSGPRTESGAHLDLYAQPVLYGRLFPMGEEDAAFYGHFARGPGAVLDLGCGTGELGAALGGAVVGVDIARGLLAVARGMAAVGDIRRLPVQSASISVAVSRLFSVAYAIQASDDAAVVAAEMARVLRPGGTLVLELPVAKVPARVQGMAERHHGEDLDYAFYYDDILETTPFGMVVQSRIEVTLDGGEGARLTSPIHVFSDVGVGRWLEGAGFAAPIFHAAYDLTTAAPSVPDDCLRAVVVSKKAG